MRAIRYSAPAFDKLDLDAQKAWRATSVSLKIILVRQKSDYVPARSLNPPKKAIDELDRSISTVCP